MKKEDLEDTKPIQPVEDVLSREEKFEDVLEEEVETREEKYQRMLEEEKAKALEEEAEKALAQKNIERAEEFEAMEEQEEKEREEALKEAEEKEEEPKKKEKLFVRFKNWWNSLEKNQKLIYGLIAVLFFLLFVLLIIGLVALLHKEKPQEEKPVEQEIVEEQAPIMFDNYYYKDGTLVFLSEGGTEIGSYTCDNKDEKLCSVAVNNYRDVLDVPRVVDESGSDVVEYVSIVNDDFVFINDSDSETTKNIVLYSIKKQEKIANYHDVKAYDGGLYAVSNTSDEYGLIQIDTAVKELIRHQYPYLGMIDNENYLVAKESKGFIIINKKDAGVSKHINTQEVKYYNNNFIVTKDDGLYSVYDFKGKQLETGHSFATVRNKYMFLIDDKKVFVKDIEGNKFNEQGVELKNFEYVKSYIYADNGDLAKTKRSFEIEVKGDNIAIAVYDVDYDNPQFSNLSITEGNINKTNDYVNYFDGVLYFYKDLEKKELIGSYQCVYKNEINSKSTEYKECFVARDSIFEDNDSVTEKMKTRKTTIPLINQKYVFIFDDGLVHLIDLQAGERKSSYNNVNSYYDDNGYKFSLGEGRFDIVALNKKGKYGVIRIDGASVASLHRFEYNKIEKIGNYFIGQDTAGKWLIFDGDNKEGIFPNKIMGFTKDLKHVKTASGNKYNVYNSDGTLVTEETYYYVELSSEEYIAIDQNRNATIYDYEGKKLTEEKIVIPTGAALKNTANPPIKVKRNGDNLVVSIYDGSKYTDKTVPMIKEEAPTPEPPTPPSGEQQG